MNIFGGFKESSDISEVNKENKPEISQDAQVKFEKIMGDENLSEFSSKQDAVDKDNKSSNLLNKFEELFNSDNDSAIESNKNVLDIHAETEDNTLADFDELQEDVFVDILDEVQADSYRLPRNGGEWSGAPGDSEWKPDSDTIPGDRNGTNPEDKSWQEIMEQYDFKGISFEDGRPDFSEVSKGDVEIDDFSDNRRKNFVQADEKLAEKKGCLPSEVRQWRTDNKYTWHEEADCKTMLKVPSEVHGNIPHDGGISEMKNQKNEQE